MYTLIVENKYGQQMELTHNDAYVIEEIDGLDPPEATINTTRNANDDGSVYNSAYVNNRQIIITMAVNSPAEENRLNLYKYFINKYPVRMYYKNERRDVYIDGFCQKITVDPFKQKQIAQITIICPEPFFQDIDEKTMEFSNVVADFEFPFAIDSEGEEFSHLTVNHDINIYNPGDVESGMEISVRAVGGFISGFTIYNNSSGEHITVNLSMLDGDEIVIDTRKKHKSITLIRNGQRDNIIGAIGNGSKWIQILPGDNLMAATTGEDYQQYLRAYIILRSQYQGV